MTRPLHLEAKAITTPTTTLILLDIPPKEWLSENSRYEYHDKARRIKKLRHRANITARIAHLPKLTGHHICHAWITYPQGGRSDPNNANLTTKAILDGLVDAHLLDDDNYNYLDGPHHHYGGAGLPNRIHRITLQFTPGQRPQPPQLP